jgi:hypothetical protein
MNLKPHEINVIYILLSGIISSDVIESINTNPNITDFYTTGHGYFLTLTNLELPNERIVCHEPMIIGESNGVESTFLIFIEEHQLTIECAGMSDVEPPEDYRNWDIVISRS